ncbi:hypothetical protein Tco_1300086 [Tanacetum coccineum]
MIGKDQINLNRSHHSSSSVKAVALYLFCPFSFNLEEGFSLVEDKIATLHDEDLKNLLQTVETASRFHATPSRLQSDGVRITATASELSQLKETLEDSASQDKDDYSTCA